MRREQELDLSQAALRGRDLVVFSNDWDGDPLSKVHIMRILARDNRVLWVNSIGNRAPRANSHDALRLLRKLSAFGQGVKEVEPNLHVLSPLALPFYGSTAVRAANRELLRSQVLFAMRRLNFTRPISWSFLPASAPVAGALGEEMVIYHCVDEFSAFSDTNGAQIAELEEMLLKKAHLCITSAERLRANKVKTNPNTVLVPHGVDFQHFVKACDESTVIPWDMATLPKPIIGFFGLIASWVDQEAIAECAKAFPNGSIVLLGKVSPDVNVSALKALSNVHFLGRRPYASLPAYCKTFDVALMPFSINELTLNSNPLKVREYLAAGLPVVSSNIPEVAALRLCRIAQNAQAFPRLVREALEDGAGPDRGRASRIAQESWESRVADIREHVGERMLRLGLRL